MKLPENDKDKRCCPTDAEFINPKTRQNAANQAIKIIFARQSCSMNAKYVLRFLFAALLFCSCNNTPESSASTAIYNPQTGTGRFQNFNADSSVNLKLAAEGKQIYNQKCIACHKLNTVKTIGPGWKGITQKHRPAWIMNYLTNTEEMLDKDPELKAMIATGSIRMPDQNLTDQEAKAVLEFMRKNDQLKN